MVITQLLHKWAKYLLISHISWEEIHWRLDTVKRHNAHFNFALKDFSFGFGIITHGESFPGVGDGTKLRQLGLQQ